MKRIIYSLGALALTLSFLTAGTAEAAAAKLKTVPSHPAEPTQMVPAAAWQKNALSRKVTERNALLNPDKNVTPAIPRTPGFGNFSGATEQCAKRGAAIKRSFDQPRGTINVLVPIYTNRPSYNDAFYGSIDLANGNVERIYSNSVFYNDDTFYDLQTGAIRDNILYLPFYGQDMITGDMVSYWKRMDLETGEVLSPMYFPMNDMMGFAYSLTYDPQRDKFYGVAWDMTNDEFGLLVEYDPQNCLSNGAFGDTPIGNIGGTTGNWVGGICYCPLDQNIYAVNSNGTMGFLNVDSRGEFTIVKQFTDEEWYAFGTSLSTLPLTYSPRDKSFITIYINNETQSFDLVFIDAETFEVRLGPSLSGTYYPSQFFTEEQYADDDAPDTPSVASFNLAGNELSGSADIVMPEVNYAGLAIGDKKMTLKVTIDGVAIYTDQFGPGAEVNVPFTVAEGMHELRAAASFSDDLVSPFARVKFYAGDDTPVAPAEVAVDTDSRTITWEAPAKGAHNGYVDPAQFTYNVYFNAEKQNAEPLTETSFTYELPATFDRRDICVTATYKGKESEKSQPVNKVFGKAGTLPYSAKPSEAQAEAFQAYDADGNGSSYEYTTPFGYSEDEKNFGVNVQYYEIPDDWLFLPLLTFPEADAVYTFDFTIAPYWPGGERITDLQVYLCSKTDPDHTVKQLFANDRMAVGPEDKEMRVKFTVPEPGEYYIGIRTTGPTTQYYGARFSYFSAAASGASATGCPADPENVVIEAAPMGNLQANFSFTAPTKDLMGNDLDASTDVTITVDCGDYQTVVTGKPGASLSGSVATDIDGFAEVVVTPATAAGEGMPHSYVRYIGVDTPLCPTNVRYSISADNHTIHLEWDAPEGGLNGGYVDTANLTYYIYTVEGIQYSRQGETKSLSFDYTVPVDKLKRYYIGPTAVNEVGESTGSQFILDYLGNPYPLPMTEEFPGTGFTYNPWQYNTSDEFKETTWNCSGSFSGMNCGDPVLEKSALFCSSDEQVPCYGELFVPKFTTKKFTDVSFSMKAWIYPAGADKYELYGRRYGHNEVEKIADLPIADMSFAHWETLGCVLPDDYQDCEWVQLRIRVHLPGNTGYEYAIIDNVQIFQQVDYDFSVQSVEGPTDVTVGNTVDYNVTVQNSGQERASGRVTVQIKGDGKVLASEAGNVSNLRPYASNTRYISFDILEDYVNYDKVELEVSVFTPDDQIEFNNSCTLPLNVKDSQLPIVRDLSGKWASDDKSGVALEWSEPNAEYGSLETFEFATPFVVMTDGKIGIWTNHDGDHGEPWAIDGYRWDGDFSPCAWTVIDARKIGWMNEERMKPVSGKQFVMARSIQVEDGTPESEQVQSADWLISPEVVGGSEVSFWFGTPDSSYKETIRIYVSSTDDNPDSFTMLRPYTKSGDEGWEQVKFTLPADTRYVAFVYSSYHQFAAMMDDIEIVPAQLAKWEIDSYMVWAYDNGDWSTWQCLADNLKETSFVDPTAVENRTYHVVTRVNSDDKSFDGPRSNAVRMMSSLVDDLKDLRGVFGDKGAIVLEGLEGSQVAVYATDGKLVKLLTPGSQTQRVPAEAGIYLVKSGNAIAKVVVK